MTRATKPTWQELDAKHRQDVAAAWLRKLATDIEAGKVLRCNVLWSDEREREHQLVVLWSLDERPTAYTAPPEFSAPEDANR